jgi:hemerythrin
MDIQWKDSYKIGHTEIDTEHQHLFHLAGKLLDAQDRPSQQAVAMAFYKYTREHFEHEETLMRETGYPGYQAHIGWHNRIISRLNEISEGISRQEPDRQALESLMNDWLVTHIAEEDAQLAQYVGNR